MKRDNFMHQMSKDMAQIREKEKVIATARKYYSRFGDRIVKIMMTYLSQEGGMNTLHKLLEIPRFESNEEEQHSRIINWLNTYGERRFVELHRKQHEKKTGSFAIRPIIGEKVGKPLYTPEAVASTKPDQATEPATETPAGPTSPPGEKNPWPPVERRSGKDRRKTPDRRKKVETIFFKNRRYGGERRNGDDRRENENNK